MVNKLIFVVDVVWKALWEVFGKLLGSHVGLFGGSMVDVQVHRKRLFLFYISRNEHIRSASHLGTILEPISAHV